MSIVLCTLNARYSHTSLGLRYLLANMGDLKSQTRIQEFVIGIRASDVVEKLLAAQPRLIGFGVYIWNVEELTHIVALLKRVAPDITIVLGGPEVSHETTDQRIIALADYVVTGWGDATFPRLCSEILNGPRPLMKIHAGEQPAMDQIAFPYAHYSAEDIAQRTVYVEASRGCPFKCEFCLSALDKTAWPFPLDDLLRELDALHARGARVFKFVDRTFNLNINNSLRILQFFLDKLDEYPDDPVFAHFELVPDHLPEALKETIRKFPPGALQFEIGIQSFNPEVQARISRKQNNEKAIANLRWLREATHAHLHVDLIAGLPGEDIDSFARGFDQLVALQPHEIQFGILKRLRGTPIIRHTQAYGLVFDPAPPYQILATDCIAFNTMQRLVRFARYWDLVANSGRFSERLPYVLGNAPFTRFLALSDWLYANTDATHRISPDRLGRLLDIWLEAQSTDAAENQEDRTRETTSDGGVSAASEKNRVSATRRQQRHQAALPSAVARQASISDRASSPSEDKGRVRARSKIISA
ncbi:MAG: hypothetical protein RI928_1892 [Pseudomonadota bacterium]|jgi:radical SAM superfamily enzyme YgiQ (UPF0313 family)